MQMQFDSKDSKKLDGLHFENKKPERLTIREALKQYFDVTEARKTAKTHYTDVCAINRYFSFFERKGKNFIDEITPYDVQMLVRSLDKDGKSEATILIAVKMIKKGFQLSD